MIGATLYGEITSKLEEGWDNTMLLPPETS